MKIECSEASTLTSASYDRKLTAGEIVRLAIHRLICGPCRLYKKQLETMRRCASRLAGNDEPPRETLKQDARERIRARLQARDKAD